FPGKFSSKAGRSPISFPFAPRYWFNKLRLIVQVVDKRPPIRCAILKRITQDLSRASAGHVEIAVVSEAEARGVFQTSRFRCNKRRDSLRPQVTPNNGLIAAVTNIKRIATSCKMARFIR